MDRRLVRIGIAALFALACLPATAGDPPTAANCGQTASTEANAEFDLAEFATDAGGAVSESSGNGYINCPAITGACATTPNCGDVTPCYQTSVTSTDTGETACLLSSGAVFVCTGGRTVHTLTGNCTKCPCCTANPPCFCPTGSCGTFQSFRCE